MSTRSTNARWLSGNKMRENESAIEETAEIAGVGATEQAPKPAFTRVPNHGLITASVMMATIMQALDSTIANVALPYMQGTMSATQDQMGWVLTSYLVAAGIMTPATGFLTERFGRRRVLLISVAGFTLTSMFCGIAQSLPEVVLFRLLQGVFGAPLIPLSQTVLMTIYPKERQGAAMGVWAVAIMAGPAIGPALGGWLTSVCSWRYVFYVNVPIG